VGALLERLLMPLGLVLGLSALSAVLARRRPLAALRLLFLAILLLAGASLPLTARLLTRGLERGMEPPAVGELPSADVIVVLGGATGAKLPPRRSAELVDASDRLLQAARLYRAGKAPLVLASGGHAPGAGPLPAEAPEMAELLVEWGVSREAIEVETRSFSTRTNALESAAILKRRGARSILLVTSAAHMRRAAASFRAALGTGVLVTPAPADVQAVLPVGSPLLAVLPDAASLHATSMALREWEARFWYRVRGWTVD